MNQQFSPLIGVDMTFINKVSIRFDYKMAKTVTMSFSDFQVIENKSQIEGRKIVIFGAGKIGRSFIGQLFGCSGYKVVFIDVDQVMISMLNQRGNYRVVIKGEEDKEIIVPNVEAISALDKQKVVDAVSTAGILAVSVGKNALEKVIPIIAAPRSMPMMEPTSKLRHLEFLNRTTGIRKIM